MRIWIAIALIALFVIIHPALALEELNASDFMEPDVTVTINNVEYKPTLSDGKFVVDKSCEKGDSIKITYTIEPKDDDKAKEVDGRTYTARTEMDGAVIKATVYYRNGGGVCYESAPGKTYLDIKVGEWEDYGLDKIVVTAQGNAPAPSSRLQEVYALKFDVQEAEENCLPPVIILVVDYTKFQNDINSMKTKYNDLSAILDQYIGKVDTSKLSDYLNYASQNISLAETYYSDGEYIKANERLNYASDWLDKAETEADKIKAEYVYNQADKKLEEIGGLLDKIEIYLEEIEEKELVNTSTLLNYKTEFKGLQEKSNNLAEELAVVKAYIDTGRYSEAEMKANDVISDAKELESSAKALFDELKKITTGPETTPTSEPFQMPSIDLKLVGLVVGGAIVIIAIVAGIRKFIRRRKWDELK